MRRGRVGEGGVGRVGAPVAGEITAANGALSDAPETLNKDPYGAGWMFKLKPASKAEVDALMDVKVYRRIVASEKH